MSSSPEASNSSGGSRSNPAEISLGAVAALAAVLSLLKGLKIWRRRKTTEEGDIESTAGTQLDTGVAAPGHSAEAAVRANVFMIYNNTTNISPQIPAHSHNPIHIGNNNGTDERGIPNQWNI